MEPTLLSEWFCYHSLELFKLCAYIKIVVAYKRSRRVGTGVKLLLKGCGSPTELMAEIQIPVSRQVAIAHVKLFLCSILGDRL